MRTYTTAIAALAVQQPEKWLDNLLAVHSIAGVVAERRQGVARRISHSALATIAVVAQLNRLGLSVARAVEMAEAAMSPSGTGAFAEDLIRITVDRFALEATLTARLAAALESAPTPRRGRPPRRESRA